MSKNVEKCPMCGLPKEKCDLMVGKGKEGTAVCCCERLQKKSVKRT